MKKDEMSLIVLDAVIKGVWCSNVGGQFALETVSRPDNGNQSLRYLERATKSLTDIKYYANDDVSQFLENFLGKVNSMEEANLLWYGTHIKVVLEITNAVDDIVPRPIAIINPETNEFVLIKNEFFAYGIIPSTTAFRRTPTSPIEVHTKMINRYLRLPDYLKEKYGLTLEDTEAIVQDKINNPTEEADLEASEEFYRDGLIKIKN